MVVFLHLKELSCSGLCWCSAVQTEGFGFDSHKSQSNGFVWRVWRVVLCPHPFLVFLLTRHSAGCVHYRSMLHRNGHSWLGLGAQGELDIN